MPVDINKTIAEASLDNLHDIIIPDAIGFLPPAPGWVIFGLLLLALLFHFTLRFYLRYKKSLYRREALTELGRYQGENKEETLQLLSLAKRVAIVAYGREESATLTGESWWNYMEAHSKVKISKELRNEMSKLLYDETYESNSSHYRAIKTFVTLWIKIHKAEHHV